MTLYPSVTYAGNVRREPKEAEMNYNTSIYQGKLEREEPRRKAEAARLFEDFRQKVQKGVKQHLTKIKYGFVITILLILQVVLFEVTHSVYGMR